MIRLRTCTRCNEQFPEGPEYFYRNGDGFKTRCKGCCKMTLKNGPERRKPINPRLTGKMVPAALALKAAGFSIAQIADDLSLPQYAVSALFRVNS